MSEDTWATSAGVEIVTDNDCSFFTTAATASVIPAQE